MSNYIVLVKQVPDVSQITDNAFDPNTGTLIRSRLASVINELDAQALAFANNMKTLGGDKNAKVVALTMGPPMAEEVLRYSLARCADTAVLLTDRNLGGADTYATANPLAYASKRIVKELFNGSDDYYIVSGMQSVDGDTAQVPAQIAEELKIPCIAYATGCAFEKNRFEFIRIISGGTQTVAAKKLPAVITVAKYDYPIFASFAATRNSNRTKVISWTADDINSPHIGVKGSKTSVIRVFPPGKSTRKCHQVQTPQELAKILLEELSSKKDEKTQTQSDSKHYLLPAKRASLLDRPFEGTQKEIDDFQLLAETLREMNVTDLANIDQQTIDKIIERPGNNFHKKSLDDMLEGLKMSEPSYKGQVWVVAEHRKKDLHPAAFELVGKARDLADSLETGVGVIIAGHNLQGVEKELIAAGADDIYIIDDPLLGEFDPTAHRKAIADAIEKYWPQIVLFAATPQGRMLAPMVSYRVHCGLTADCTSLNINDSTRKSQIAVLLQTRPALGGNVMATICTKNSKSQMATARPGVLKRLDPDYSRKGNVIKHTVEITPDDLSLDIINTELASGEVNFAADIIVSGGKGMQSRDKYDQLLSQLIEAIAKKFDTKVERGASRAAVEQGFIDRAHQVGQTGTAVGPKLYVAIGISGAIQHMIGVANTETIVAINNDHNAPILKQCDYYIIANAEDVIPELVKALEV